MLTLIVIAFYSNYAIHSCLSYCCLQLYRYLNTTFGTLLLGLTLVEWALVQVLQL
jgi:hypothetical protein